MALLPLLTDMYPHVEPDIPGCPRHLVNKEIISMTREFCMLTQAWTHDMDPVSIKEGVSVYDLEKPGYADVDTILSVVMTGGRRVDGENLSEARRRIGTTLLPLRDYRYPSKLEIELVNEPGRDLDDALLIELVLLPRLGLEVVDYYIPDDVFKAWHLGIAEGVLWKLMRMRKKEWSDPAAALEHRAAYWEWKAAARVDQQRGGTVAQLTASAPWEHQW